MVRQAVARTPKGEWIVLMPMELAPKHGMPAYVSTPDQLAEGRLIVGAGIAADAPPVHAEFAAAGVPFDDDGPGVSWAAGVGENGDAVEL